MYLEVKYTPLLILLGNISLHLFLVISYRLSKEGFTCHTQEGKLQGSCSFMKAVRKE